MKFTALLRASENFLSPFLIFQVELGQLSQNLSASRDRLGIFVQRRRAVAELKEHRIKVCFSLALVMRPETRHLM